MLITTVPIADDAAAT